MDKEVVDLRWRVWELILSCIVKVGIEGNEVSSN